jgi:RNA polymerase sigma-70 factor (ECF subfamily)
MAGEGTLTPVTASAAIVSPAEAQAALTTERVYASHGNFVWTSLQQLGVRPPDLNDVSQEVFVVVHQRRATYDSSASLRSWLYGICLRVAANYRKRAHRRYEHAGAHPLEDSERVDSEASRDPESAAAASEARAQLAAILDAMDLDLRAVFVMFEIEELSCDAIAASIGVAVGTVYSRLHAARRDFEARVARWRARTAREVAR